MWQQTLPVQGVSRQSPAYGPTSMTMSVVRRIGLKILWKEPEQKNTDKVKTSMIALGPTQFGRPVGEGLVGVLPQDEPNDNPLSLQLDQDSSCPSFSDGEIEVSSKNNGNDKATGDEQAAEVKKRKKQAKKKERSEEHRSGSRK